MTTDKKPPRPVPAFTDQAGRLWPIQLSYGVVRRCRADLGVDILAVLEDDAAVLQRLATDLELLVNCLWLSVERRAGEINVDEVAFAEGLGGESLAEAAEAFWEALANFFPSPTAGRAFRAVLDKLKTAGELLATATIEELEAIDVAAALTTPGGSASSSPASSASPHGTFHSASST